MPGVLVVTHGGFAEELVKATKKIVGDVEAFEAVSIGWNDQVVEASKRIEQAIRRVDRGKGVLLLTDMFGGTPTNLALSFLEEGRIEIITGVNLPMLIKLTNLREEQELPEVATKIAAEGKQAIHVASHVLEPRAAEDEEEQEGS